MCIFSGQVSSIANTKIFARSADEEYQLLVYSMQYSAADELAMILPLPTPVAAADDAVHFIDLSDYTQFFDDMAKGFIEPQSRSFSIPLPATFQPLTVHEVGSFQASFVPTLQDFSRLDTRFRLTAQTWDQIPRYSDYGFAVFKLQAGAKNIHPMAFSFPRRNPGELFFPTVHIHDGSVEEKADFDHELYCQTPHQQAGWLISSDPYYYDQPLAALHFMDCDKAQGLVDPIAPIQMKRLHGLYINDDIVIPDR